MAFLTSMIWRRLLGTACALALAPVILLALLTLSGWLDPQPACLAMVAAVAGSLVPAALWQSDVVRLATLVQQGGVPGVALMPRMGMLAAVAIDIDRRIRARIARDAATERRIAVADAILENLPDPLIVLAGDRSVARINTAARTAFGHDVQAVLRHPTLRAAIDRVQLQGGSQQADLSLPVPYAREVHATAIHLKADRPGGAQMALVLSDHTRERAVERMREDFVANASHELRTPLASLIGFIDTLKGPAADDPPAQQRFLGIMAAQAARMNRLIDDLLSLSRIELNEHRPPAERLDVAPLIRRIVAGLEPRVAARRVAMQVTIDPALPNVIGDSDQLEQVLQNLLDNAIKYGREGGTVRITAGIAERAGRWPARPGIVLAVRDEGPGIARVHLGRLTERFYRVDKGRSRDAGGTGLGLAIVKHIVNRHRGQLLVDSEEGKGSVFTVWLPLAP